MVQKAKWPSMLERGEIQVKFHTTPHTQRLLTDDLLGKRDACRKSFQRGARSDRPTLVRRAELRWQILLASLSASKQQEKGTMKEGSQHLKSCSRVSVFSPYKMVSIFRKVRQPSTR